MAAVLDLVAHQPRDVAAAATLLIRVCTLWFGVTLGAAALVRLSVLVTRTSGGLSRGVQPADAGVGDAEARMVKTSSSQGQRG